MVSRGDEKPRRSSLVLRATALFLLAFAPAGLFAGEVSTVQLVEDPREAMGVRLELIRGARTEVQLLAFSIWRDPHALSHLAELREAARRGLRVRLILDAYGNRLPRPVLAHLEQEGVEIRLYHPFRPTRPHWILRRMHDKLLIVDGERLLIGGRNIGAPFFGFGPDVGQRDYLDRDVLVSGPVAVEAAEYFLELWDGRSVAPPRTTTWSSEPAGFPCHAFTQALDRWRCESRREDARQALARAVRMIDDAAPGADLLLASTHGEGPDRAPRHEVVPVDFLRDPLPYTTSTPGTATRIHELLDAASESIVIESPYLVPTRAFLTSLRGALDRGVEVSVLTNSLASTSNLFPQAAYVGRKARLVRKGVEIWEYQGPESLHAKTLVVDGRMVVIGSFNVNRRSEHMDTETAVAIEDSCVAADILATIESRLENAARIGPDGRPEGFQTRYPGVPRSKVIAMQLFRLLAPLISRQI
jgi:cardiolipin synthase C